MAPGNLWAVGYYTDDSKGAGPHRSLTLHWDGTGWSLVPSLNPSVLHSGLGSIALESANRIWAGGSSYTAGSGQAVIARTTATCP